MSVSEKFISFPRQRRRQKAPKEARRWKKKRRRKKNYNNASSDCVLVAMEMFEFVLIKCILIGAGARAT